MDFIANFNKNRARLLESVEFLLQQKNPGTFGEWLIKWQIKIMKEWIGYKGNCDFFNAMDSIVTSFNMLFIMYCVNTGICETLGLNYVLPKFKDIYEWAVIKKFLSSEFKPGDIVIWRTLENGIYAGVIDSVDIENRKIHTIEATENGEKMIFEADRSYKWEDRKKDFAIRGAIDMEKIYNSLVGA